MPPRLFACAALLLACAPQPRDPHLSFDLTRRESDASMTLPLDVAGIARRCGGAVVVVLGDSKQGSGVILGVNPRDLVVTNAHVVAGQASLTAKFANGAQAALRLLIEDPSVDLALLELPAGSHSSAVIGSDEVLRVGDGVVAIGAPLGLEQTVTSGDVSSFRDAGGTRMIQVSTPVSPGSSGGGLFDARGSLVGITTLSAVGGQNLNFAVPVSAVKALLARARSTLGG